jgi:hypothetical protein
MSCRVSLVAIGAAAVLAACADQQVPTTPSGAGVPGAPATTAATAATASPASAARERLTAALAIALNDPAVRAAVKRRLDRSNAPEGKLQFQALSHADQGYLLTALARHEARTVTDLLADLDQARGLELYFPVPAQRHQWAGDTNLLVATIGQDGQAPVAYTLAGTRLLLDPSTPPARPVLALVPQETDFTNGHPERVETCIDMCAPDPSTGGGGSGSTSGSGTTTVAVPGLYLVQSHISGSYESWLKGSPEYEYHVYGVASDGSSTQLACAGPSQNGADHFDQSGSDWSGRALLLSDDAFNAYQRSHPGAPVRIVAWEDDNEACVDHADSTAIISTLKAVDNAYRAITSGKVEPWYARGIDAAPSIFTLLNKAWNLIKTNDDFIGNAVSSTITGSAPDGANWELKYDGIETSGWFTTAHLP